MKPGKTRVDLKENVLLDDVYKAEKEIDAYLVQQAGIAEDVVRDAQEKVIIQQELIASEAEESYQATYEQLLMEARNEAEKIVEDGIKEAEKVGITLEERKGLVMERILELLLEKKQ